MPAYPHVYPFSYYSGSPVTADVPSLWPVALNGRPYMLDTAVDFYSHRWRHDSLQLLRPQADQSSSPSEASLNPDALWRRASDTFHGGAGQTYRDRGQGDETRFRSSKGVDIWTKYQVSLLNGTALKKTSANTNVRLVAAGVRCYCADGTALSYATTLTGTPFTNSVSGYTGGTILSLCSDGYTIYVTDGADIWTTNTAATTVATSVNTLNAGIIAYVKGRLMAAGTGATKHLIYNITTIGTPPAALNAPIDTNFTWVGFAEGPAHIYAAGYSGDKSLVYRIAIKGDGTTLDAPVVAGELPDGETVTAIGSYLGFITLGTSLGVRFCEVDGQGNLVIGARFSDSPCYAFEGQDRYIWFGWDSYDATSTGLGRMDLTTFTENFVTGARVPAYASDLMVTGSGSVLSVVTFLNTRVFTISGAGVYADSGALVTSGTLDTGCIGFGIPDEKIALSVNVRSKPLLGSYSVALSIDEATTFGSLGTDTEIGSVTKDFPIEGGTGRLYELRFTLTSSTTGPTLTRWTMKATTGGTDSPAEYVTAPILLRRELVLPGGQIATVDVLDERERLKELRRTRAIFNYQEAETVYAMQMETISWVPDGFTLDDSGAIAAPNGTMVCTMKRLS